MKKERKRQQFTGRDFIMKNGELIEIDPKTIPGLADRCLLAIAEMTTGKRHVLVRDKKIV